MVSRKLHPAQIAIAAVVALGCALPAAAGAAPPLRDRFPVEAEFDWQPMSDACGFPVTLEFTGTFDVRVFTNGAGPIREIDTQPSTKLTYRSANGEYSVPFSASLHTSYPDGIFVGAPAYATLTGAAFAATGRAVLEGSVVETEDGFAFTRLTEVSSTGNSVGQTDKICSALAG